jgi:hypothetical protein
MQMPYFVQSAARVVRGLAAGYGVVLMCAEADPLMCHRFCLLGRYFQHIGVEVVVRRKRVLKLFLALPMKRQKR